jgi:hypothetical protein
MLPSAHYTSMGHCIPFFDLSIPVPEPGVQWLLSRNHTLGTPNFHWPLPRLVTPTYSSSSETVRVEASWVACEEEIVSRVLAREKMVEASTLSGGAGANASPHRWRPYKGGGALVCRCSRMSCLNPWVFEGSRLYPILGYCFG